ncbi:manganese efflux pump MntP family protein [Clostridium aestuarii]|uniref:Putative manganese efflux pump MntP n=1 Tax=Clostridium aestuarii TaxID=338193 RepID=A0ABT4D6D6_9CLOT|nr:manganese efflux pump MntP family protein [Clostridium aestuarii]MCY6485558.1 manganese efflux pump MntP family protein [Clostridium aestuarii]
MNILSIIFIAFGLAMDAFAVSITSGIIIKNLKIKNALKISFYFGGFQALMPLIGWAIASKFRNYIIIFDHWIAFIFLGLIGGKMIYEAITSKEDKATFNPLKDTVLLFLAIATSIDALIVGISFALLKVFIIEAISIIGLITFVISFVGVLIGKKCGELLKKRAEITGGIVLILIGTKTLIEHLIQ